MSNARIWWGMGLWVAVICVCAADVGAADRGCGPECDYCWLGTEYENNCPMIFQMDGYCDCGCQFPDEFDCESDPCGPGCDHCWYDTTYENNCRPFWEEDGFCDCGCQFDDEVDCGGPTCGDGVCEDGELCDCEEDCGPCPCGPECDYCWFGTSTEGDCPTMFEMDGDCDCGCQFPDTVDCEGSTVCGNDFCETGEICDCEIDCGPCPCDDACDFCWWGTQYEGYCLTDWIGDGSCDCGCQFDDEADCGVPTATLTASRPAHDGSLWRSQGNVMALVFDSLPPAAPEVGQLLVQQLQDGHAMGPDQFASLRATWVGQTLILEEQTPVFVHRQWYAVRNVGDWPGVAPFEVHVVVQVGDANEDGFVLPNDLSLINMHVPTLEVEQESRFDIQGDGRVLPNDLSVANTSIPSLAVPKPSGH